MTRKAKSSSKFTVRRTDVENPVPAGEIARLAYLFWQERGGQGGSAEDDWFRAEKQLCEARDLNNERQTGEYRVA